MQSHDTFTIDKAQRLPGVLLWQASKLWQQALNAAVKSFGLSSTNAIILCNILHLSLEERSITQVDIAKLSGVDAMTASQSLRVLERQGYIVRDTNATDKRANQLALTSRGDAVAKAALEAIAVAHQAFFRELIADGSAQSLADSLEKLLQQNNK